MSGSTKHRLRSYLAALSPQAQVLLVRELEREANAAEDASVVRLVLEELRQSGDRDSDEMLPRSEEAMRLVLRPLTPFLVEDKSPRVGTIRRSTLLQVWQWLKRDALSEPLRELEIALTPTGDRARGAGKALAISYAQRTAVIAISEALNAPPHQINTILKRIGPAVTVEDLESLAGLLRSHDLFETLARGFPRAIEDFAGAQLGAVQIALSLPALQSQARLPFALTLTMKRLRQPWQIIRLATRPAASNSEHDVRLSPYAVAVDMAIEHVAAVSASLQRDMRRGDLDAIERRILQLHEALREIQAELDPAPDSVWKQRLSNLRANLSETLRAELESIPGRVRRLLRQRVSEQISKSTRIEAGDVQQTIASIAFLARSRDFADELELREVTNRIWAELTCYVAGTTDALLAGSRGCAPATANFRRQQVDASMAFREALFGRDHVRRLRRTAADAEQGSKVATKTPLMLPSGIVNCAAPAAMM